MNYLFYIVAGCGAGIVTGLAGLSAAVVITPVLVSLCGCPDYDAVTIALASDVLASLFSSYTYYKNKNIDLKRGIYVMIPTFAGTCFGSYCGYVFTQAQPSGLGYISMVTTIGLGVKFLLKPVTKGKDEVKSRQNKKEQLKTILAMMLGLGIGWVCGFTGSGGGILMLTVFTIVLGYNLKIAVGTSTMIMSIVALTGTISHFALGASIHLKEMILIVLCCLVSAIVSARYANRCEIRRLNKVVGIVLFLLGLLTLSLKLFF